jgi:uncharacterized protein YecE (DUF72 family)
MALRIGTAGWSIPRDLALQFPSEGSGLSRYAARFPVAEINSSFHRPHRSSTWERWRDSVPPGFKFSAKMPKLITHTHKLEDCSDLVEEFVTQASALGDKLAVLLVQLPPKLVFNASVAGAFFTSLRRRTHSQIACEPRHPSWFATEADALLERLGVARVAADPAVCDPATRPGRWGELSYWRLHGSPVIYRSSYSDRIDAYASKLADEVSAGRNVWCIFDNTASSAGAADALALMKAALGEETNVPAAATLRLR